MYQETEKFKKYGKLFMPLVGAVLLLPFLAAGIVSVCLGNFKLDGKKVSMYTAAIDDHVIYLNSDEGKKAVEEAARLMERQYKACPFYRNGDEYAVVRKQI